MKSLPKRYRFPGGPWVTVKEAPRADVNVAAGKDTDAFYVHQHLTVWIDASQPVKRRWKLLWHEMAHALVDQRDEVNDEIIKPWGK